MDLPEDGKEFLSGVPVASDHVRSILIREGGGGEVGEEGGDLPIDRIMACITLAMKMSEKKKSRRVFWRSPGWCWPWPWPAAWSSG